MTIFRCRLRHGIITLFRLFAICMALSSTYGCTRSQPENIFDGTSAARFYRNSSDDVITLNIPKGHIDYLVHGGFPRKPIEADLYFVAEAPTLKPRSKENNASFEYPNDVVQQVRFSIRSRYQVTPEERRERMHRVLTIPFDMLSRPCIRDKQFTERFGLERYSISPSTCPQVDPSSRDDILIERNADASIKTIIKCMPDDVPDTTEQIRTGREAGYRPLCEQSYELPELNSQVTIFYAREYNKEWRLLQQRVNALLVSFIPTNR